MFRDPYPESDNRQQPFYYQTSYNPHQPPQRNDGHQRLRDDDENDDTFVDVQNNIQQNAISVLNTTRRTLPVLALIYLLWNVIEIVTLSTIIGLTWEKHCNEPTIRVIIIARIVRNAFMAFVHLRRLLGVEETELDYKIQGFSRLSIMMFFIFSQQWYTDGEQCKKDAPLLYWCGIGVIVLLYLTILFPIILLLLICACLPCVLTAFRFLNIGDLPQAASESDMQQFESFQFEGDEQEQQQQQQGAQQQATAPAAATSPKSSQHPSRYEEHKDGRLSPRQQREEGDYKSPSQQLSPPPATAPTTTTTTGAGRTAASGGGGGGPAAGSTAKECAICLCEYEKGDELLKLKCGHIFHKPCITDWCKLNASCPIDRRDLGGNAQQIASGRGGLHALF